LLEQDHLLTKHSSGPGGYTIALALLLMVGTLVRPPSALAVESELDDSPAPDSVEDAGTPFEDIHYEEPRSTPIRSAVREALSEQAPFFRETSLVLQPRTYYFNRRREDGTRAKAWALGGALKYRSGYWKDVFSVGATLFTSQRLIGKKKHDGTRLLRPGQKGYTVLGESFVMLRYKEHQAKFYRQTLDLPYVNRQDSRMTPNTFEAYLATGAVGDVPVLGRLEYVGGYISRMKERDDNGFVSMSEVAGADGSNKGMSVAGIRIEPSDGFTAGAVNYHVDDTINIAYTAGQFTRPLNDELSMLFGSQFTYQNSVGEDRLTGSSFETWVAGARVGASYRGAIVSTAFSTTDDEERIRSPFGSYPGYLSGRLGLKGMSAFTSYAEGYDARDAETGESLPDQREFDFTLDYHLAEGRLDGFWLRARISVLDVEGMGRTSNEGRVILNYELPLL
jgi:hypothetical protein